MCRGGAPHGGPVKPVSGPADPAADPAALTGPAHPTVAWPAGPAAAEGVPEGEVAQPGVRVARVEGVPDRVGVTLNS